MDEIGYEDCFYGDGVSLIEWSQLIEEILPEHVTEIAIEKDLKKDLITERYGWRKNNEGSWY